MLFQKILDIFSKNNNIKTLFLVDILYMKDLNAIYDFKNGDFIIRQLDSILKTNIKELIKLKVGYFMDDLFDIVEDETLSFDDDKNENDIKKKTEIKDEPAKKESILEKYGEN